MKRREVLKGLSIVAGSALCTNPAWSILGAGQQPKAGESFAVPIRALARKDGTLLQPVQLTIEHSGPDATAITKLNGREVDSRVVSAGKHTFNVFTNPVISPQHATVEVDIAGKMTSTTVALQPVRKLAVYILPHSHHDLGYTDLQANVEEKQMANITRGIELARKTAAYPEGARFVWNLEVLWGADLFIRRKSAAEKAEFLEAVKKGWVSLNGMYANELTGLCRPEELLQLFRYSSELGNECGIRVDSAMISDVPGYTWGTVTAMAQAGIRYFSAAPNYFDRIGTFMVEWQDKPFWWVSPSGKEKVLVWVPWTGYAMSSVMKMNPEWVGKYQDRLDSVKFPYDISYIRWSGHGDNAEPDPEISEFVKEWNSNYEWPRLEISSTSKAFSEFERKHGSQLPEFRGDLTPYWEDGAGSSAVETRMSRLAADRLSQASALSAMLAPSAYKAAKFNEAWRNVLLYSEHTWGAWCSVSDSENPFTTKQWDYKREFAVVAKKDSESLLSEACLPSTANHDPSAIDVHNTTSWARKEVIVLSKEMSTGGDRVKDEHGRSIPSQRLSTGELAFLADVPPFGTARYRVVAGKSSAPATHVAFRNGVLENGIVRAGVDPATGNIVELALKGKTGNLVNVSGEKGINEYLLLEGKDLQKIQSSGPVKISVEEPGPLVATIRIESSAPGCDSLVRKIRLTAEADWLELINVVDKKRTAMNPHPGKGGPGDEFAQRGAKESVQFAFPFAVPEGKMRMDIPLGMMRPETDQLPGSCKNWLTVGRWIDIANTNQGVTWVSLDAPLVEVGGITATMLGSQTNPTIWREHIEPTQKFYSWVMNNHWGTNYRAYQEGVVEFRYALRPHNGYNPSASSCLAIGLTQPLLASPASEKPPAPSLLRIEPADVLAVTFKPSDDGKAWIVKLFGASGEDRKAKLTWSTNTAPGMWISDSSELPLHPVEHDNVTVAAWDLVTLRADRTASEG
ncbi:MAG TPA: glycoside hydrolase family 38 C-terminal domain-containing protein [Acidisarcina sp.]|nr:glycoside hydrolase family 38 C-terminal domain-containing protein [Acidisarcina sp.]